MNTWLKYVGIGSIAFSALACGSKGEDDGDDDSTGGTSSGGTSSGGTSTGGSGGSGTQPPLMTWSFDDAEDVCPAGADANTANCWKLVDSNADMTNSEPIPPDDITFEHTTDDGDPDEGAFQANIPYDKISQWVSFGINFQSEDLTGRTITAHVKVVSGLGDPTALNSAPAGSKIYAKSGEGYCYANGDYFNQGDMDHPIGQWSTIRFNLARPPQYQDMNCSAAFDPSDIREIGIQIDSSPTVVPDEAVVLIDSVQF